MTTLTRRRKRDDEQEQAKAPTPAVRQPAQAAQILHLQRSVGNRAVAERLQIDRIALSAAGNTAVGSTAAEKSALHAKLLNGGAKIVDYTKGVCYDTVAFMLYLDGRVTEDQLTEKSGEQWLPVFDFDKRTQWTGGAIPAGSAVGFRRTADSPYKPGFFHAATAVGGTTIRAVNGHLLGQGWETADLASALTPTDRPGIYTYDNLPVSVHYW